MTDHRTLQRVYQAIHSSETVAEDARLRLLELQNYLDLADQLTHTAPDTAGLRARRRALQGLVSLESEILAQARANLEKEQRALDERRQEELAEPEV